MPFLSNFEHQLDDKGRLTLPSKYRAALAGGVVVTRALKNRCLVCHPVNEWEAIATRDAAAAAANLRIEASTEERQRYAFAEDIEVDKQGRILIPERLRRYAGITGRVLVAGLNDHLEFWEPSAWAREVGEDGNDGA